MQVPTQNKLRQMANSADPEASTVVFAIWHGQTKILELLLDSGADPNARDGAGHTPLYYAQNAFRSYFGETSSNEKAIEILKAHGGHLGAKALLLLRDFHRNIQSDLNQGRPASFAHLEFHKNHKYVYSVI